MIKFLDSEEDSVSISAPLEGDISLVFRHKDSRTEYVIKKGKNKITQKPGMIMMKREG